MNWQTPQELPDLRRVGIIALDTETHDEGLHADRGSSWPWRDGYVCGISVAWRADGDIRAIYIPLRHPDTDNFDPAQVYRWLEGSDRVRRAHRHHERSLRLGLAAHRRRHRDAAVRSARGDRRARDHGRREPASLQPRRALRNATACPARTRRCCDEAVEAAGFAKVSKKINATGAHLATAGALCRPLRRGRCGRHARSCSKNSTRSWIRKGRATPIGSTSTCCRWCWRCAVAAFASIRTPPSRRAICCSAKRDAALAELSAQHRRAPSAWPRSTAANGRKRPSTQYGISYPRTAKGNPSFAAGKSGWMAKHEHWLPRGIATASKYDAAGTKFLEGHILNHIVNGRIHAEIHPYRAGRRRHALVALCLLQSAAAADAVARQGTRAADPQRVPAGGRRVLGQAGRQPAGISPRGALRRAARTAGRAGGGRGLSQQSRRRLSRRWSPR